MNQNDVHEEPMDLARCGLPSELSPIKGLYLFIFPEHRESFAKIQ